MKVLRDFNSVHPVLVSNIQKITKSIIDPHSMPFRIFETGRLPARHAELLSRGKTTELLSKHIFDLEIDPPLYCTAVDFVYYDEKWSWNLRDSTILNWYKLFGNMVSDMCPDLYWKGLDRQNTNYSHFELTDDCISFYMDKYPCIVRKFK